MFPTIFKPTRPASGTLLDNVFLSWPGMLDSYVLLVDISDHVPTVTRVKTNVDIADSSTIVFTRSYNAANMNVFIGKLATCNWDHVLNITDVDKAFEAFQHTLQSYFYLAFPLQPKETASPSTKFKKPWLTSGLLKSSKMRSKLYRKFLKHKISKEVYTNYRNVYVAALRKAKFQYFSNLFERNKKISREIWNQINKLKSNSVVTCPTVDVNLLNDFFADLGPSSTAGIMLDSTDYKQYVPHYAHSFFLRETDTNEIISVCRSLKPKVSSGYPDGKSGV
jgi:hypothetical protein